MNEVIKKISILSQIVSSASNIEVKNRYFLEFTTNKVGEIEELLKIHSIDFDNYQTKEFSIDLKSIAESTIIFLNETTFRELSGRESTFLTEKNIAILIFANSYYFYDQITKETFIGGQRSDNYLISNTLSYLSLIEKIQNEDFADYFNSENKEIVLYSSSNGILKINIPVVPIPLDNSLAYSKNVEIALKKLSNDDYIVHFKNQLFKLEKESKFSQIESLFKHLDRLIQDAENNYQLQVKNFSFEKFKDDLQKEKEKYFSSLREILNKILSQTVGVPISIGASIFASYKIEDRLVLLIILLAFAIYVFFAIHFQLIYRKDVLEIEADFKKDFKKIIDESGLEPDTITIEQEKIKRRIKSIKNTIYGFIASITLLAILFFCFLAYQVYSSKIEDKSKTVNIKTATVIMSFKDSTNFKPKKNKLPK